MVLLTGDGTPGSLESRAFAYLDFLLPSRSPCSTWLPDPTFGHKIRPSNQAARICERDLSDGLKSGLRLKGVDLQSQF